MARHVRAESTHEEVPRDALQPGCGHAGDGAAGDCADDGAYGTIRARVKINGSCIEAHGILDSAVDSVFRTDPQSRIADELERRTTSSTSLPSGMRTRSPPRLQRVGMGCPRTRSIAGSRWSTGTGPSSRRGDVSIPICASCCAPRGRPRAARPLESDHRGRDAAGRREALPAQARELPVRVRACRAQARGEAPAREQCDSEGSVRPRRAQADGLSENTLGATFPGRGRHPYPAGREVGGGVHQAHRELGQRPARSPAA